MDNLGERICKGYINEHGINNYNEEYFTNYSKEKHNLYNLDRRNFMDYINDIIQNNNNFDIDILKTYIELKKVDVNLTIYRFHGSTNLFEYILEYLINHKFFPYIIPTKTDELFDYLINDCDIKIQDDFLIKLYTNTTNLYYLDYEFFHKIVIFFSNKLPLNKMFSIFSLSKNNINCIFLNIIYHNMCYVSVIKLCHNYGYIDISKYKNTKIYNIQKRRLILSLNSDVDRVYGVYKEKREILKKKSLILFNKIPKSVQITLEQFDKSMDVYLDKEMNSEINIILNHKTILFLLLIHKHINIPLEIIYYIKKIL